MSREFDPGNLFDPQTQTEASPRRPSKKKAYNLHLNRAHEMVLNEIAHEIHSLCIHRGWYSDPKTGRRLKTRNVGEMIALAHSELSEALEAWRKDLPDSHLNRPGLEVELADTIIRILDLGAYLGLDVGGALVEKVHFNLTRPDHSIENRRAAGGKKI